MKIHRTAITLKSGESFEILHNFKEINGADSFLFSLVDSWEANTSDFSPESLVAYIKQQQPDKYIVTYKEFTDRMPKVLHTTTVTLENGDSFDILYSFKKDGGLYDSFFDEVDRKVVSGWMEQTTDFSPENFVAYLKERQPDRVIMTQKEFQERSTRF